MNRGAREQAGSIVTALSVGLLAWAALVSTPCAAADVELPMRKAGLWDVRMGITGGGVPTMVVQHCTDAATDKDLRSLYSPLTRETCDNHDISKTATGYTGTRTCKRDDGTVTDTRFELTGDFQSAYQAHLLSRPPDASPEDAPSSDMTLSAKYLGPCKSGQEPGDIIMMAGMKINIRDVMKMREKVRTERANNSN